jgi:hypothetical protein
MGHKNMELYMMTKDKTSLGYEKEWREKPELLKKCRHKKIEHLSDDKVVIVVCNSCNFYYYKKIKEEKVRKVNDEKVKDKK